MFVGDLHESVGRTFDPGIRHVLDVDLARPVVDDSLHLPSGV
jgi:hypothetical protein